LKYDIINSGSDGNCTVVDGQIAIDMGIPFYKIEPFLKGLKLVLLTHEHSDHFRPRTVKKMAMQRPTLKWVCRDWMVQPLLDAGVDVRNVHVLPADQWQYYSEPIRLMICPFDTQHDVPNCGWKLWKGENDSLFYATDLGTLDGIEAKGYSIYLLEANHTEAEIEAAVDEAMEKGEFTYRTRAAENHLSQEQAVDWLTENMGPTSMWVPMHQHKETHDGMVRSTSNYGEASKDAETFLVNKV